MPSAACAIIKGCFWVQYILGGTLRKLSTTCWGLNSRKSSICQVMATQFLGTMLDRVKVESDHNCQRPSGHCDWKGGHPKISSKWGQHFINGQKQVVRTVPWLTKHPDLINHKQSKTPILNLKYSNLFNYVYITCGIFATKKQAKKNTNYFGMPGTSAACTNP